MPIVLSGRGCRRGHGDRRREYKEQLADAQSLPPRPGGAPRRAVAASGRIPAESKEKLFLPYFSTKGRGTGLGLAIVHRIVSDHHGSVRVEDNVPTGSVFTLELPLG